MSRALEEAMREENVPAEQPQAKQKARFPPADAVEGRASGAAPSPDQGPLPPVGLIWPIRERSSFRALASGRRRRRGVVMVTSAMVGSPTEPPRVAFAVGRHAGGAVARNKIRRRLRAATRAHAGELEPGRAYLVGVVGSRAAPAPYATLSDSLAAALRALREEKP
jgi:ribonuclease P protein component